MASGASKLALHPLGQHAPRISARGTCGAFCAARMWSGRSSGKGWSLRGSRRHGGSGSSALQTGELAVGSHRILLGQARILSQQLLELRREEGGAEVEALVL